LEELHVRLDVAQENHARLREFHKQHTNKLRTKLEELTKQQQEECQEIVRLLKYKYNYCLP
jgi:hypothetical protein